MSRRVYLTTKAAARREIRSMVPRVGDTVEFRDKSAGSIYEGRFEIWHININGGLDLQQEIIGRRPHTLNNIDRRNVLAVGG